MKLVSILIPAWNAEKWIAQSIQSALSQTWVEKEIVIIDDGSEDRTLEIARTFESERVKVVTQGNRGAASARNAALALAGGDFIQWLDADDVLAPDKIDQQMKSVGSDCSDFTVYSSPHGVFYYQLKKAEFTPNSLWRDFSPIDWLIVSMSETLWMNPAAWLVSRTLTEKAGPWDDRLSMDDDGEYFARVVAASDRVRFVRDARCYYRQSGFQQLSRRMTGRAVNSLVLSTILRIDTLLALEKSERTKQAGLAFLQAKMPVFFPEKLEALAQLNTLAAKLGGALKQPVSDWRLRALNRVIGPANGKRFMHSLRRLRMAAAVKWDELMYRLGA
jgi:glycosyltransferase involved in cell wall biosynthesis